MLGGLAALLALNLARAFAPARRGWRERAGLGPTQG
jgi:hypothetical protein